MTAAAESAASSATPGGAALHAIMTRPDATLASLDASEMGGRTDSADAAGTAASHTPGVEVPIGSRVWCVRRNDSGAGALLLAFQ